jgi:hypothetical protein
VQVQVPAGHTNSHRVSPLPTPKPASRAQHASSHSTGTNQIKSNQIPSAQCMLQYRPSSTPCASGSETTQPDSRRYLTPSSYSVARKQTERRCGIAYPPTIVSQSAASSAATTRRPHLYHSVAVAVGSYTTTVARSNCDTHDTVRLSYRRWSTQASARRPVSDRHHQQHTRNTTLQPLSDGNTCKRAAHAQRDAQT